MTRSATLGRRLGLCALCAALAAVTARASARAAWADDDPSFAAEDRARIEVGVAPAVAFVGEPVRARLRVLYDAAWFEAHAVHVFQRPFDVPVRLDAAWLRDVPGTTDCPAPASAAAAATVVVNGDTGTAHRVAEIERDGRRWSVVEIERRFVAEAPGALTLGAPTARFTWAARFTEDLFDSRVAVDPRDATVFGEATRVVVHAVPDAGRPAGFTGAIGRFAVRAEATPLTVDAGATVRLTLHVEGEGNLTAFDPPSLGQLDDFHVVGTMDDRGDPHRTIAYELAPFRDDVTSIPPIAFAYFDTTPPASYRTLTTDAIQIAVRPGARPSRVGAARPPAKDDATLPWIVGPAVAAAAVLAAAVTILVRRRARRVAPTTDDLRARDAAAAFRAALASGGEPSALFAEFLAAHLRCAPAAVVSTDLAARLVAAGASAELAARAARRLDALIGARYSGAAPDPAAADEALCVANEIQTALGPPG
ncbi:MAG: BatD family protein [Planctomycetes bacterium]|nr:BatD family protein [Planctomycetota bacterium]